MRRGVVQLLVEQAEIADVQAEFQREKEDILDTIRELSRQLKLKQLIMSSFIPLEQLSKIERRCVKENVLGSRMATS